MAVIPSDLYLTSYDRYISGLIKIRKKIRSNGTLETILPINVHNDQDQITLYMNMAFDSNNSVGSSLYILGFRNTHGTFAFNIPNLSDNLEIPDAEVLHHVDGSYGSFGYNNDLPTIASKISLWNVVNTIAGIRNDNLTDIELRSLGKIVIAVSEALRFDFVAEDIASNVLRADGEYNANTHETHIHGWNGSIGK